MRKRIPLLFRRYFADGDVTIQYIAGFVEESDVKTGRLINDGRKITSVDEAGVILSDGSWLSINDAISRLLPVFEGIEVLEGDQKRVIADGPDQEGRIMFEDLSEAFVFGFGSDPFLPLQKDRIPHLQEEDRRLREQAGLILPPT